MVLPLGVLFPAVFFATGWFFRRHGMPEQVERPGESSVWAAIAYASFVTGQLAHTFVRGAPASLLVAFCAGAPIVAGLWLFARAFLRKSERTRK
jgi:hypothetical protein